MPITKQEKQVVDTSAKQKRSKAEVVKLHHEIVHMMPVVPSRKRVRPFKIERAWGEARMIAEAEESLNHYDFITLGFLAREHQRGNFDSANPAEDGRERVLISLDVGTVVRERGLLNKKPNRRSFVNSVLRWHHTHLTLIGPERTRHTWLVSEVEYRNDYSFVEVYANKRWLDWCIKRGIIVHLNRLVSYGDNGNAVLIDAYLQSTKLKLANGGYAFRDTIPERELMGLIDPEGKRLEKHVRQEIKEAMELLRKAGLPPYEYDKVYRCWRRADFLDGREI